eukprot:TRINITY_DN68880_c0_g1_i1.p2 TRINITY_DN68880_c0_g1~~TRINITY_DN68880_c0_g1_i1.p2  ORF type:complete len:134 (-),score=36.47 TRINITY_DN68880_c0_g1_i1:52-453(-)
MSGERDPLYSKVASEIDDVTNTMQENMREMVKRDAQLGNLTAKTDRLQDASAQFGQSADRLQAHYKWQKYRMYIIAAVLLSWVLVGIFDRAHVLIWILISTLLTAGVFFARAYMVSKALRQASHGADPEEGLE